MLLNENASISIRPFTLPSGQTLNDIFGLVSEEHGALLFDSSRSKASKSRFNIMLWDPAISVIANNGKTHLKNNATGEHRIVAETPFDAANRYLHSVVSNLKIADNAQISAVELPFIIGVAGMASYDTGRFYETLPNNAINDYTTPDFVAHLYLHSLIEDTESGKVYFCSVDDAPAPTFSPKQALATFSLTTSWKSNLTKQAYTSRLATIKQYLQAGDCYQINMAQRFSAKYQGSEWQAYEHLRQVNNAPFSGFMRHESSCVMSISPERFLKVKDGVVETKPIKGTRPRYPQPELDQLSAETLLSSPKDRAENLMIVDLLRNDLSIHCKPNTVNVPSLFALESYEAVHHMVSTVIGELKAGVSPLTLLASAFPGGSITGAPKVRAMEIIDELEPNQRNIYCGSLFYLGFRNDMDSSICIRTLLAENNTLHCWAGGGIVLDSVADEEYQETLDKVSKILPELEKISG